MINVFYASAVDAKFRGAAAPMMGIDPAGLAKIMSRCFCVPLIHAKVALALDKLKLFLACGNHDGPFATANRTITPSGATNFAMNFKFHSATVTMPLKDGHLLLRFWRMDAPDSVSIRVKR